MPGRRIHLAQRREAMGFTQEELGLALSKTRTTVYRWEKGETDPRPYVKPKLARLLGLSIAELEQLLVREPDPSEQQRTPTTADEQSDNLDTAVESWGDEVQRREFLHGIVASGIGTAIGPRLGSRPVAGADQEAAVQKLHRAVDRAIRLEQRSQFAALTALLPGLIGEARQLLEMVTGEWRQQVTRLLATAEVVQAYVLIKQDRPIDAQAVAADAMALADAADDPVLVGSALRCLGESHMRDATYDLACDLALEGAAHIDRWNTVTLESLAVEGAGFLTAATASARGGDRPAAVELLDAADRCAERMGQDVVGSVVFGPTNVAIHRVALEVELGDPRAALRHAMGFDVGHRPGMDERQARYLLDVARAEVATDQAGQAVETLLHAESISPEEIRTHRLTKGIVIDLIATGHGSKGAVQQLAARSGVSY
ncbi:MAG: helix-turn-helix transcriptional regulator [Acidimicrobiales bacterium]